MGTGPAATILEPRIVPENAKMFLFCFHRIIPNWAGRKAA